MLAIDDLSSRARSRCFGMQEHAQKLSASPTKPIETRIPSSELLEAFLVVSCVKILPAGSAYARGAEAGGPGSCDHGRHGVESAGAAGLEAAEAIGPEEGRRLRASCNAQQ